MSATNDRRTSHRLWWLAEALLSVAHHTTKTLIIVYSLGDSNSIISAVKGQRPNLLDEGSIYKDKNNVSAKINSYDELITAL